MVTGFFGNLAALKCHFKQGVGGTGSVVNLKSGYDRTGVPHTFSDI